MLNLKVLLLCVLLPVGWAASFHDVAAGEDNSVAERDQIFAAIKTIAERLDRWDDFYMGRLEPRMVGAATSLANLDTNIRNLQERAHVWDTFQLHVSSWNDQIKALDHKMNIINEGYGKLLSLDSILYSALKPNGSLRSVEMKLATLDEKIEAIAHGLIKDSNAPIVSEFAGRGVLHTLKVVERKLDRIQMIVDRTRRNNKEEDNDDVEEVRCAAPTHIEELLQDVSSKVDSIFDRNDDSQIELSTDAVSDTRHMGRACKKLMAPQKKLLATAEYLKNVIQELVGEEPENNEKSMSLRNRRRLQGLDEIKDTLEDIERGISNLGRQQDRNINENEKILRRLERKIDAVTKDDENDDDLVIGRLKRIEAHIKKVIAKQDDDDDDDDDTNEDEGKRKRKNSRKNNTDEDDDDSDEKKSRRKSRKNNSDDDDDDDDDDNDSDEKKGKGRDNDTDEDDDNDDSDDNDKKSNKGRNNDSDDDDDDDDNDSDDRKKGKGRQDTDEDDTDEDNDDDDDDDDGQSRNGRRGNLQKKVDKRHTDAPVTAGKNKIDVTGAAPAEESATISTVVHKLLSFTNQE